MTALLESRGRNREDSPDNDRGRLRSDAKGESRKDRSRSRSPRRRDDAHDQTREARRDSASQSGSGRALVVKCRGLPYSATERDIKDFFSSCAIERDGIVICMGRDGRPSGDCYVKFRESADFEKALKRDREQMSRRYIEVFPSSDADMDSNRRGRDRMQDEDPHYQGVVRMRGLPYSVSPMEIQTFFRDLKIRDDGVHMCIGRDGRPNGEAFVEFVKEVSLGLSAEDAGFGSLLSPGRREAAGFCS